MKKIHNFIILISNIIVGLAITITLALFLSKFKTDTTINIIYDSLRWTLALPIVSVVICCGGIGFYLYILKNVIKNNELQINPRLFSKLKTCCLLSFINCLLPLILSICGILVIDKQGSIVLLSVALAISGLTTIVIWGYVAYINFSINFSILSREELKKQAMMENQKNNPDAKKDDIDITKAKAPNEKIEDKSSDEATAGWLK